MANQETLNVDFANQALIQDETLVSICLVLEQGWPAGPTFLQALNTLIEAVVIHDAVYFDPHHQIRREDDAHSGVPRILKNSDLVSLLVQEGAIHLFPDTPVIDSHFASAGRNYSFAEFLADFYWSTDSFAYGDPAEEANELEVYVDLVSKAPLLLQPQELVPRSIKLDSEGSTIKLLRDDQLLSMVLRNQLSMSEGDLHLVEGLNFKAKAYLDLAQNTGLHLHPFYLALPHQIGAIRKNNSTAMKLFRQLEENIKSLDEEESVGETRFGRSRIPALTEVVLGRCKDSPKAIALELLELRTVHREFRDYLTDYERKWKFAHSKRDRWRLESEFDNALKKLLESEKRQATRVMYTLWDFIKEPTKILKAVGDYAAKKGQEKYVVGRVKGLHDFWNDLANSPPSDVVRRQFDQLFPKRCDDHTWEVGRNLAAAINASLVHTSGMEIS